MNRSFVNFVMASAMLGTSASIASPTVTLQPDEPAAKDAWAYQFFPTTDMNVDFFSVLPVGTTAANSPHSEQSFVQFDLSAFGLNGSFVQSATLSMHLSPSESTGFGASPSAAHPLPVSVFDNTSAWSESVTWDTRPTHAATATSSKSLVGSDVNNYVSFDVTASVKNWLSTPSTNRGVSLIADQPVSDDENTAVIAVFDSSSTDTKPFLTINFNATPGDANLDGKVDIVDLGLLASHWQQSDATWQTGDFNDDGHVNIVDLGSLASNWQSGSSAAPGPGAADLNEALESLGLPVNVPEPAGLGVLAAAALGLNRRRRVRSSHA